MATKSRDTVAVGIPHNGHWEVDFSLSLLAAKAYDAETSRHLAHAGWLIVLRGTNIAVQRNSIVDAFLDGTEADWLLFIDTDQRFRFDIVDQLLASADADERPIVSALIMAEKVEPYRIVPACLGFKSLDPPIPVEYATIPNVKHWQVGAIGTGCVLIHRKVFVEMRKATKGDPWPFYKWAEWASPTEDGGTKPDILGEDYTFSLRAQALGFPVIVDPTIEAGHIKKRTLTSADFWASVPPDQIPVKTFVVIPVKDQLKMTKALLHQLREQGGYDEIFVLDNGSNPETRRWLGMQKIATVVDAADMGIHEMWNAGANLAMSRHPRCNIAFLNNDLELGDGFLSAMSTALRSDPALVAVSGNYDNRESITDVVQLKGICADRYDGTGGLAGFAFMVKSEWFGDGWRFPEDCKWWFGDNDLTLSIDMAGGWYAMAIDAKVTHLDGGGQTGKWDQPEYQQILAADRDAFVAKWSKYGVTVA